MLPLVAVLEVPAAAGPPVNLHVVEVMPLGAVLEVSGPPVGLHVVAVLPLGAVLEVSGAPVGLRDPVSSARRQPAELETPPSNDLGRRAAVAACIVHAHAQP